MTRPFRAFGFEEKVMRRNVAIRMGAVLLSCAATSRARGDEPPTLPPPGGTA